MAARRMIIALALMVLASPATRNSCSLPPDQEPSRWGQTYPPGAAAPRPLYRAAAPRSVMLNSTRRLRAFPSSVVFGAIGRDSP